MKRSILRLVQAALFITIFVFVSYSLKAQPVVGFSNFITSGLSGVVDVKNAADGTNRLFIVEQQGRIRIYNGTLLSAPFLNIQSIVLSGGERGLLGVAFPPDYETSRYFFVYYNNLSGDVTIARYQTQAGNPNLADPASGHVMISIPKPFDNHNGGDLNFGPDGMLYFATGDGGSGGDPNNNSQNGLSLLGKMMRININDSLVPPYYSIPASNPYTSDPTVDDLIWAIGLRNPWRWSFDKSTGDLWLADVGQGAWEEVNFRPAGITGPINYGWRCYEGHATYNTAGCLAIGNYTFPIFDYPHNSTTGGFSITGGYVYRGSEYPVLQGYYICADYVSGNVWLINANGVGGWTTRIQAGLPGNISAFGEAEDGTLYAASLSGQIYKIDVTDVLPVSLISFSGTRQTGYNELKWNISSDQHINRFILQYSTDGVGWTTAGDIAAVAGTTFYSFNHYTTETGKILYRLLIEENNGSTSYSSIITLNSKAGSIKVFPTVIQSGVLQVTAERPVNRINLISSNGQVVMNKELRRQEGYFTVGLPALSRGMYWVQLQTDSGNEMVKIIIQ